MIHNIKVIGNNKYMAVKSANGCEGCAIITDGACRTLTEAVGIESCSTIKRPDRVSAIYKHYEGASL